MSVKVDRRDSQSKEVILTASTPGNLAPETEMISETIINKKMVGWYDPRQLLRTARDVFISTIIGQHADRRLIERINDENANEQILIYNFSERENDDLHKEMLQRWEKGIGVVTMFAYLMASWCVLSFIYLLPDRPGPWDFGGFVWNTFTIGFKAPMVAFWGIAILVGFYFFTDTHSKPYKFFGGVLHGLTHVLANHLIIWIAYSSTILPLGLKECSILQIIATVLIIAVSSFLIGPLIMGVYLLISVNGFHRHYNEAFSSLKIEDWKNFVRMKIDSNGDLTVYPIGIRKTPRKWRKRTLEERSAGEISWVQPKNKEELKFELIEEPFIVKGKGK